jgi:3-oxoacyl-[acyl-carrier-protein] synthase II
VKGACQTIIGSRTSGLDALRLATARIAQGTWDHVLVGAGEEFSPLVQTAYRGCGSGGETANEPGGSDVTSGGFGVGCGAVMLVLESKASVEARGGRILATVESAAAASPGRPTPAAAARVIRDLGPVDELIRSECGLWVDRVEARGLRLLNGDAPKTVTSLYGRVAEAFSAGPLAGVAAAILNGGVAGGNRTVGVVATDVTGVVSGVRVRRA